MTIEEIKELKYATEMRIAELMQQEIDAFRKATGLTPTRVDIATRTRECNGKVDLILITKVEFEIKL